MARLNTHVHVHHPNRGTVVFGPDDDVPGWARKLIRRDDVWADDGAPEAAEEPDTGDQGGEGEPDGGQPAGDQESTSGDQEPDTGDQGGEDVAESEFPPEPPRSGAGSGVDAWREFAAQPAVDLEVVEGASRDDIIAAWDAANAGE